KYFNLWIQAKTTHANVGLPELIGMTFRKVNPNIIVRSKIMAVQAGMTEKDGITTRALEAHYLAGGNVPNVVRSLIAAHRADIADIDVGDNIGANLQAAQAEADTRVARAKAEERRAFAVAMEQEMLAAVQENRAKVIQAEAEVPLAIADAFRKGNLGITDYYQ